MAGATTLQPKEKGMKKNWRSKLETVEKPSAEWAKAWQLASKMGLPSSRVYRLVAGGDIAGVMHNGAVWVKKAEAKDALDGWGKTHRVGRRGRQDKGKAKVTGRVSLPVPSSNGHVRVVVGAAEFKAERGDALAILQLLAGV